jgi:hypothetical protein
MENDRAGQKVLDNILHQQVASNVDRKYFAYVASSSNIGIAVATAMSGWAAFAVLPKWAVSAAIISRNERSQSRSKGLDGVTDAQNNFLGSVYNNLSKDTQSQFDHIALSKRSGICKAVFKAYDELSSNEEGVPQDAAEKIAKTLDIMMNQNKQKSSWESRIKGHSSFALPFFTEKHQSFKDIKIGTVNPLTVLGMKAGVIPSESNASKFESSVKELSDAFVKAVNPRATNRSGSSNSMGL